jgi:hypothetical protein
MNSFERELSLVVGVYWEQAISVPGQARLFAAAVSGALSFVQQCSSKRSPDSCFAFTLQRPDRSASPLGMFCALSIVLASTLLCYSRQGSKGPQPVTIAKANAKYSFGTPVGALTCNYVSTSLWPRLVHCAIDSRAGSCFWATTWAANVQSTVSHATFNYCPLLYITNLTLFKRFFRSRLGRHN